MNELLSARVLIFLVIMIAISLLSASLVFLEPQQVGVVVSLFSPYGYREQPMRSGLHFIAPMVERVDRYPIYWQTYTMSKEPQEGEKIGDDSISARTSDGQAVFVDTSVIYRIDANEAVRVHIDWQERYIEDFIRPLLRGVVRTEVSQFTADEVNSSKRKILEENLEEKVREAFSEKGFVLDRFLLRNIAFSSSYAAAIEAKQVAEQERIQREYEAEQMRKTAEGQRDRMILEAEGQASALQKVGQAEANVTLLKAEAESKALALLTKALQDHPELLTYRYIDKLAPSIRTMLLPSNNPFLLPLPDYNTDIGLAENPNAWSGWPFTDTITSTLTVTPSLTITPTATP
jgi:regulator of protease activity HflC (stomatin/prohibitin superfamily)